MKKNGFIILIIALCFIISCNSAQKTQVHRFIDQEHEFYKTGQIADIFDDIIVSAEPKADFDIANKKQVVEMLRSIRSTVLSKMDKGYDRKISLLGESLKTGKWRCDKLSFIYLAMARKKNWPVDILLAPQHMFIKWRLSDNEYLYWETTNGKVYDDAHYISKFKISRASMRNGIYMTPLKNKELQAVQYINIGRKWAGEKRFVQALVYYDKAIALWPNFSEAYNNRAIVEIYSKKTNRAIQDLNTAIKLDPNCASAYYNRGRIWLDDDQYEKALTDFDSARKINPKNMILLGLINYIRLMKEKESDAIAIRLTGT